MVHLKTNLEDVEKIMKQVKAITSCDRASEVYPRYVFFLVTIYEKEKKYFMCISIK